MNNDDHIDINKNFDSKKRIKYCTSLLTRKGNEDILPLDEFINLINEDHHVYEIYDGGNIKLFMDIEFDYDLNVTSSDFIQRKIFSLKALYRRDGWLILNSSGYKSPTRVRLSYHLIHPEIGFRNHKDLKAYVRQEYSNYEGVDTSVYSLYQKFRAPGQSKGRGDERIFRVENKGVELSEYLITSGVKRIIDVNYTKKCREKVVNLNMIADLLNILSSKYYDEYKHWILVGFALKSCINHKNEDQLYELWDNFSKKSTKYSKSVVARQWGNSQSEGDVKLGSIFHWARECDEDNYFEIISKYNGDIECRKKLMQRNGLDFIDFANKWDCKEVVKLNEWASDIRKVFGYCENGPIYMLKFKNGINFCKDPRALRNRTLIYGDKRINFWQALKLIGIKRVTFREIIFRPLYFNTMSFNLWTGFKAKYERNPEEVNMELIQPLIYHMREILCNGNKNEFKYLCMWLANIVQFPNRKNGTAVIFIGQQGCGKNIFGQFLRIWLIGDWLSICINDIDKITGRFNNPLSNKILIVLDEISNLERGYHKTFDKMKSLITEKSQMIEKKGIDSVKIEDYSNYMMFSNNYYPVKIEPYDRRYAIFQCSNAKCGDVEYFNKLGNCLCENVAQEFMKWLMELNINKYNLQRELPNSVLKSGLLIQSLGSNLLFLKHLIRFFNENFIIVELLWNMYNDFCDQRGLKKKYKCKIIFCRYYINKFIPRKRMGSKRARGYYIDKNIILVRVRALYRISLEDV